jgi:hypothetical protein
MAQLRPGYGVPQTKKSPTDAQRGRDRYRDDAEFLSPARFPISIGEFQPSYCHFESRLLVVRPTSESIRRFLFNVP